MMMSDYFQQFELEGLKSSAAKTNERVYKSRCAQ